MTQSRFRRIGRLALWIAGSLAIVAILAYLLRWPLLEGTIRSEIVAAVREHARADVEIGTLSGSLVSSISAADVRLIPDADAPFREASIRAVHVEYGLFGSGEPVVRVEGARVVLAPGPSPAPPLGETVRDIETAVREVHLPLRVQVVDTIVVLADGRRIEVAEAKGAGGEFQARGRTEDWGEIEAALSFHDGGALIADARSTEGPVQSARLVRGAAENGRRPLVVLATVGDQEFEWRGESVLGADGRIERVEGRLTVPQGSAVTWADFVVGRAGVDADATHVLQGEVEGKVSFQVRAEGPVEGPLEEWSVERASAYAAPVTFRKVRADRVEVMSARGTLARLEWSGRIRRGTDEVEAKGTFAWGETIGVAADVDARIASLDPYRDLVAALPPELSARGLSAKGRLEVRGDEVSYDGAFSGGKGSFGGEAWESFEGRGSYDAEGFEIASLVVTGHRFAPLLTVSGELSHAGEGAWKVQARMKTPDDTASVEGLYLPDGDFEGRVTAEGAFRWLETFQVEVPESWRPLNITGSAARTDHTTRLRLKIATADGTSLAPALVVEERDGKQFAKVEAGTIVVGGARRIRHDPLELEIGAGTLALSPAQVTLSDPEVAARISGSVAWDAETMTIDFEAGAVQVRKWAVEPLKAQVKVARGSGEVSGELRWGAESADHLIVAGRVGKVSDLRASLLIRRFDRSTLGRILDEPSLRGGVSADLHLTGTLEKPDVTGTFSLREAAWGDLPPLSLTVPIRTDGESVRFWVAGEKTAYGVLSFEGKVPLPGSERAVDISGRLATREFVMLEGLLPAAWRPGVKDAEFVVEGDISGPPESPVWGVRATFACPRYALPEPLAAVEGLRAEAVLDASGLVLESFEGRIGHGRFSAEGRWDLWRADRPMELRLEGRELLVVDRRLSRVRLTVKDGRLSYREGKGARLEGEVEIPLALVHEEFGTMGSGGVVRGITDTIQGIRLLPGKEGGSILPGLEGLEQLALALEVRTSGECRIENSMVGALVEAHGRVRGTAAAPIWSGRAQALSGEVKLPTAIFIRIESAEAVFPEKAGNVPQLRFVGSVGTGGGAITVILDGPLSRPNLILKSEPPRDQEALLALLAFGQEQGAVSESAALGTVASKLASQYTAGWPTAEPKDGLLARLKPTVIDESSDAQSKPWELPDAGSRRGTVVRTEYLISPFFSIVADSDRDANVSGDIKLRLRFR